MKKRIISLILLFTASITQIGCYLQPAESSTGSSRIYAKELTKDVGMGVNLDYEQPSMQPVQKFAYDLMVYNMEETNPIFSPVSAYIALCMAGNGAEGKTKKEFSNVLGGDMMCIPDTLMNMLPQDEKGIQLTIANSAWLDQSFAAEKEWLGTVKSLFSASVYQAKLDTKRTMKDMNQWVSMHTNKMIPNLLKKPLNKLAKLALINALYFHADWEYEFDAANTRERLFQLDNGKEIKVPMMHMLYQNCEYVKDDTAEGVILPYKDSKYAFAAIKPLGSESIRKWYASYSAKKLSRLLAAGKKADVSLGLVKFTAKCRKDLNDSLKEMGIIRAFDAAKADFSSLGKTGDGNLYISLVLQEAVIKIAEKGTEASAATIVEADSGGAMEMDSVIPVTFDRSFLYMIMDMENEIPVFMGIMDNPE